MEKGTVPKIFAWKEGDAVKFSAGAQNHFLTNPARYPVRLPSCQEKTLSEERV